MHNTKKPTLTRLIMVRMDPEMRQAVETVANASDLSSSDIIRLAVRRHLPVIKSGLKTLRKP